MVRQWLARVEGDVLAAEAILAATLPSYETAAFHAQQSAEKALKAMLVRHQVEFKKDHDIMGLLESVDRLAPGVLAELSEARALTAHAVDGRYPSDRPPVDRNEARRQLGIARRVVERVRTLLAGYLSQDHGEATG